MIDPVLFPPDVIAGAQHTQKTFRIPACVILAQYAQESHYGEDVTGDFNYWGEKWVQGSRYGFKECPTEEYVNGKEIETTAKFVSFPSPEASFAFQGWALTNANGPYGKFVKFLPQWRTWLHLMSRTYSSDPTYEQEITRLISQYGLEHYDV